MSHPCGPGRMPPPPDVGGLLPERHLARHVGDLTASDLTVFYGPDESDGRRNAPNGSQMMVRMLPYGYATGVCASPTMTGKPEGDAAFLVPGGSSVRTAARRFADRWWDLYPNACATTPNIKALLQQATVKNAVEMLRRNAVEHLADVVVARDAVHAEQHPRVRGAPTLRKETPVRQKGRTLHEEHGKCRKADIAHRISGVAPRPPVRRRRAPITRKPYAAFIPYQGLNHIAFPKVWNASRKDEGPGQTLTRSLSGS